MNKLFKFLLVLALTFLTLSCGTVYEPISVIRKQSLSAEEIAQLEDDEESAILARYDSLLSQGTSTDASIPKISNIYVDADIRSVLMDIATQIDVNIIPDNTVEGSVSLILNEVELERAFAMILYPGAYKYRYIPEGNYYIVGKSLPDNSSFDALTITKTIKTNRGAEKVISQISKHYLPYLKADGQVITITATPDIINRLERDISFIDKARRLVEITAQFVMLEWDKGSNIGIQWSDINLAAMGITDIAKGSSTSLSSNVTAGLNAFLSSHGYDTKIQTIAEPRIVVEDGEKAELNITEEHLFLILSGGGAAYNYFTTKEVSVGIKLKVQPFVSRNGEIRLNINPEVADIIGERDFKSNGGPSQKLPIIARRSTETTLKVKNGETFATGGLITKSELSKGGGIPLLRKIPIIGYLFGAREKKEKETELIIFITPKIIG